MPRSQACGTRIPSAESTASSTSRIRWAESLPSSSTGRPPARTAPWLTVRCRQARRPPQGGGEIGIARFTRPRIVALELLLEREQRCLPFACAQPSFGDAAPGCACRLWRSSLRTRSLGNETVTRVREMRERPGPRGEDTPRADMYQLYRAADWTSPPAPVIAQAVTPTAASWCATDGGARPWKGCLRAGSRRGVQLARSGRHARTASAARARHSNAVRPAPGRDAVRQKPRQLYLACEAAILAVVMRSSTTRKAIETQRDLFLGRGMHDPRDAPRGSLRTGGLN